MRTQTVIQALSAAFMARANCLTFRIAQGASAALFRMPGNPA